MLGLTLSFSPAAQAHYDAGASRWGDQEEGQEELGLPR